MTDKVPYRRLEAFVILAKENDVSTSIAVPLFPLLPLNLMESSAKSAIPSLSFEFLEKELGEIFATFDSIYVNTFSEIENTINQCDQNEMFDPEEILVAKLEEVENSLKNMTLEPGILNDFRKKFCDKHLKTIRDLRWKILIRDGKLALNPDRPAYDPHQWKSLLKM